MSSSCTIEERSSEARSEVPSHAPYIYILEYNMYNMYMYMYMYMC